MSKHSSLTIVAIIATLFITSCDKTEPNNPVACFVVGTEIVAGIPTQFTSSCSVNAISFSWSFGDGSSSTEANPLHTYNEGGTYSVTLTVANDAGGTDESTQSILVETPSLIEHSGTIEEDETWIEGMHLVVGDVYVEGAILTIEPGATIMFVEGTGLYVGYFSTATGGTLKAVGTAEKQITFTSSAATKSPGDWDYIGFYGGASNASSMQHCIVEYGGGYSANYGMIVVDESSVAIDHSTLRYSEHNGIVLYDEGFFQSFTGNTLMENGSNPITIYGNYVHTIGSDNNISTVSGVVVKSDEIIESNAIWQKQTCAYVIEGSLHVGSTSGSTLTLNPGVQMKMSNGARITVGYYSNTFGTLIAEGTAGDHIRITSSAPDVAKAVGDWDYIAFYDGAGNNSSLDYCDIEYGGGYSANYGMIVLDEAGVSITNSTFENSESSGITLFDDAFFTEFTGNTVDNNGVYPIEIYGNFAHTIGAGNNLTGRGILVDGDNMEQSEASWIKQTVPYLIDGTLYIGSTSGATLTIEPGTAVEFSSGSRINIGYYSGTFGSLVAVGEPSNRITFSSGAPDGAESPGDWDGIWFSGGTLASTILEQCILSYGGGYSGNSGNLTINNETAGVPVISNCQIEYSEAWGIYVHSRANPTLTDNIFGNNVSGDINP